MKTTDKHNRSRDNGSKKGKDKQAQPVVKRRGQSEAVIKANKERKERKQEALKNKVIHTPHGTARALKRKEKKAQEDKAWERRHQILDDPRSHYLQLGLIREAE